LVEMQALRERNYGIYEGHELVMQPNGRANLRNFDLRCPHSPVEQGETLTAFAQRVHSAFESLATQYAGQNIMVFAHGGVIDIVCRLLLQKKKDAVHRNTRGKRSIK